MKGLTKNSLPTTAWIMRRPSTFTTGATSSARTSVTSLDLQREQVDGQRMTQAFSHIPVMCDEVVAAFSHVPAGIIVDGTLGGAGHSSALLESRSDIAILGIDRDPAARAAATERLREFGDRSRIVAGNFSDIADVVAREAEWIGARAIVGVLLDLGVSSTQFDDETRGFSFRADAALDMRMNPEAGQPASEVLAAMSEDSLRSLLVEHGEGRFARAIARSILARRPQTTFELVAAVEAAVPMAARRRGHVATRTFQAVRVLVNAEAFELDAALAATADVLAPEGLLVVLSYHSGEDKVVKEFLRQAATGGCTCPVALGCVCGAVATFVIDRNSSLLPSEDEVERNPRSRSARMRTGRKVSQ